LLKVNISFFVKSERLVSKLTKNIKPPKCTNYSPNTQN